MRTTLSVIKADIGSIDGYIAPSRRLMDCVAGVVAEGREAIHDHYSHTGDDIALLMAHLQGVGSARIHKLACDAFVAGTAVAKEQGLYGAGQDLPKDSFAGAAMLPMSELDQGTKHIRAAECGWGGPNGRRADRARVGGPARVAPNCARTPRWPPVTVTGLAGTGGMIRDVQDGRRR